MAYLKRTPISDGWQFPLVFDNVCESCFAFKALKPQCVSKIINEGYFHSKESSGVRGF